MSNSLLPSAKGPKIKARLGYAYPKKVADGRAFDVFRGPCAARLRGVVPVHVLPADDAAYEAMCEQVAQARFDRAAKYLGGTGRWKQCSAQDKEAWAKESERVLKAIGIKRTK